MIKVKTKNGETDLSIFGDMSDICADTVAIVIAIRKSLAEHDPHCGEIYEEAMKAKLIELAFGPEADKAQEKDEKTGNDVEAKVDDFVDKLTSLIDEFLK